MDRLAGMVELFSIWHFSLVALGLQAVFSLPPKKSLDYSIGSIFCRGGIDSVTGVRKPVKEVELMKGILWVILGVVVVLVFLVFFGPLGSILNG